MLYCEAWAAKKYCHCSFALWRQTFIRTAWRSLVDVNKTSTVSHYLQFQLSGFSSVHIRCYLVLLREWDYLVVAYVRSWLLTGVLLILQRQRTVVFWFIHENIHSWSRYWWTLTVCPSLFSCSIVARKILPACKHAQWVLNGYRDIKMDGGTRAIRF